MTQFNSSTFDDVYQETYAKMFNFARRLCRNKEEAEDITQEAYIKAYASIDQIDQQRSIENWLMRIVFNNYLDLKRKKSRRVLEAGESIFGVEKTIDDAPDSAASPEALLMMDVMDPIVRTAIKKLDPKSKQLLQMVYVEERDQKEIGLELGVNIGTIRSQIHRALAKVRIEVMTLRALTPATH